MSATAPIREYRKITYSKNRNRHGQHEKRFGWPKIKQPRFLVWIPHCDVYWRKMKKVKLGRGARALNHGSRSMICDRARALPCIRIRRTTFQAAERHFSRWFPIDRHVSVEWCDVSRFSVGHPCLFCSCLSVSLPSGLDSCYAGRPMMVYLKLKRNWNINPCKYAFCKHATCT